MPDYCLIILITLVRFMKLLEIRRKLNYRSDQLLFILTRITSDMLMTPPLWQKVKKN